MRILQASTADLGGGAERVARNLFHAYQKRGHSSWLAVGSRLTDAPGVLRVPNDEDRTGWSRACVKLGSQLSPLVGVIKGAGFVRRFLTHQISEPLRWLRIWRGYEDFSFPASWRLLDLPPQRPDLLHCHNLHGGYFDLRVLPALSCQLPLILTLHDAWLLSGHCAHSFDCDRWKAGCGHCPDLTIPPAVTRDATAGNWQRKQAIYAKSRLYVSTPSAWLMRKVEQSMLAPAIHEARVIPYGVDLSVFRPGERMVARLSVNLPSDATVVLFAANGIKANVWKDYETMRAAIALVGERLNNEHLVFVAVGDDSPSERLGTAEVRFVPYQDDPRVVASYYQAADVYLHAARADTFPNAVLEALACGIPVVATAVGGIPEQVKSLGGATSAVATESWEASEATGILVRPRDIDGLAAAIELLITDTPLRRRLGENASRDARARFDHDREAEEYLSWYQAIVATAPAGQAHGGSSA